MSAGSGTLGAVKPALRAGLLPLWRDRDTVQIGIDPRRAIAVSGMSGAADVIRLLDGSRDRAQLVAEAEHCGVPAAVTERILTVLATSGVLVDHPVATLRAIAPELRRELMPVLATASLSERDGDGGARLLARRSAMTVQLRGSGLVAASLTDLLTRSGLAVRRSEPPRTRRSSDPDLLVLVGRQLPDRTAELLGKPVPHLGVYADEAIGVVGPFVQPGGTACLRCIDLARTERDPAWPLILAQLTDRAADPSACDPVLATSVAAQAAAQVIAFADRSVAPAATANGTLELVLPSWQWRRRTWLPHPACTCGSYAEAS